MKAIKLLVSAAIAFCTASILFFGDDGELGGASGAFGQTLEAPSFAEFPVHASWNGTHPKVILDTDFARNYRTRLRSIGTEEPDFAGHYNVGFWGCGMSCIMGGIVDLNTGKVIEIPFTICCYDGEGMNGGRAEYYPDSSLIVFRGILNEQSKREAYYRVKQGTLVLVSELPLAEVEDADESANEADDWLAPSKTFGGYSCSVDCSGHDAGYRWAMQNRITDEADCGGKSRSFIEGCVVYVTEGN